MIAGNKIMNVGLKRSCEELSFILKPIAEAIDVAQKNTSKIADAVIIWKKLEGYLTSQSVEILACFKTRYRENIRDFHMAAFLLSPKYAQSTDFDLTDNEKNMGINYIENNFPLEFMNVFMKFRGKIDPFRESYFKDTNLTDYEWWKAIHKIHPSIFANNSMRMLAMLLTAVCSTAGLERIFSIHGIIHSKLRNKLGNDKAAKLVFLSSQLKK